MGLHTNSKEGSSAIVEVDLAVIRSGERRKGGENRKWENRVSHHDEYLVKFDKIRKFELKYRRSESGLEFVLTVLLFSQGIGYFIYSKTPNDDQDNF